MTASSEMGDRIDKAAPIRLVDVRLGGIAGSAARSGEVFKCWTRLSLTSDDELFQRAAENISNILADKAAKEGRPFRVSSVEKLLLVLHSDATADLYVNNFVVALNVLVKRSVEAGEAIFDSDVADISGLRLVDIPLRADDGVLFIFRRGWRFGMFLDFNVEGELHVERMEKSLGAIYRKLVYRRLYDAIENNDVLGRLIGGGWFPFAEIIGQEFNEIMDACEAGFDFDDAERRLVGAFDNVRLKHLTDRWAANPNMVDKMPILQAGIDAFLRQDAVAAIKILVTEIEGVLVECYAATRGRGGKMKLRELTNHALNAARNKSGGGDTLLLPDAFADYLDRCTFAEFDRRKPIVHASSRHAVGHGAANAQTYTLVRALQVILTLDQLAFYTS